MSSPAERLRQIRTFPQLVKYLRDELDWPIEQDNFDDLMFEWDAAELGIDPKSAAKIEEIKQLRPLTSDQPWGVFFIKFAPRHLPIVALRRILGQLVVHKRASVRKADQKTWAARDLLFISAHGEGGDRELTFAHFSDPPSNTDLPTLRVLGWDEKNTNRKLDYVASILHERLSWPTDSGNDTGWRERWSSAFELRPREVITTSKELSLRLAQLARLIRERIKEAIEIETEKGPLTKLLEAFQKVLIYDLDADGFADMYAQTIAYGLLSARIADPDSRTTDDFARHMRTNPFLRELMETFLKVGGRRDRMGSPAIDFDELGVSEVVELLDDANMEAVVGDFDDRNPQEDPVIHFYEGFAKAYDPIDKVRRGEFYTPRTVVSYIVRSVDRLLRTEFGLEDGLADITTWEEMAKRHNQLEIPQGVVGSQAFVQILDPATGTGTFLVEVIDLMYKTLVAKWNAQGFRDKKVETLWNEYVPKHLLPRLHAYELKMAPYAIAHLKVGLKLHETGYRFESTERARIYLTNALEPASGLAESTAASLFEALGHEAQAVNAIKRGQRFTVVIGNPPYSRVSQNHGDFIRILLKDYKAPVADESNQQPLDDDYIKFLRLAHYLQSSAYCGVIGFITNHTVLSGVLFRGVRQRLLEDQNVVAILDLHGNSNIKEKSPDGSKDANVFDIQAGVAVTIAARVPWLSSKQCIFHELWGPREAKYLTLQRLSLTDLQITLRPAAPYFFLRPIDLSAADELKGAFALPDIFPCYSSGLMTVRDNLAVAFHRAELQARFEAFISPQVSDRQFQSICPVKDYRAWTLGGARRKVRADKKWTERMKIVNYRPFDKRWVFYSPDIVTYPNFRIMDEFTRKNLGLVSSRIHKGEEHAHEFVTREMIEIIFLSSKSSNNAFLFPLYHYEAVGDLQLQDGASPNLSGGFLEALRRSLRLNRQAGSDLPQGVTPEDIFYYAYAVLHSPGYRSRYAELLKFEFPRLPLTESFELFGALGRLGGELVALHLLESHKVNKVIAEYIGGSTPEVERVSWSAQTVWMDKDRRVGFRGVPKDVWDFHIGGYRVCEKWLKDRKGRKLSKTEIEHYQKVVMALTETIRIMSDIDHVIGTHGGWPEAFHGAAAEAAPITLQKVAEERQPPYESTAGL